MTGEKELIETFAGYSHEEIDLERYRKKDRAKFSAKQRNLRTGQKISGKGRRNYEKRKMEQTAF